MTKQIPLTQCPACGKPAEKRGLWKNKNGSQHRLYVHGKEKRGAFVVVTSHCMVEEQSEQIRNLQEAVPSALR